MRRVALVTRWLLLNYVWASVFLASLPTDAVETRAETDRTVTPMAADPISTAAACAFPTPLTPLSTCIRDSRNVLIGQGAPAECQDVVVDRSYTGEEALGSIRIGIGGRLFIPDQTVDIETEEIQVNGLLQAGTADCPIGTATATNRITVTFTDARGGVCVASEGCQRFDKGIEVGPGGSLRFFGAKGVPPSGVSWTHLSRSAGPEAKYGPATGTGQPRTGRRRDDPAVGGRRYRGGGRLARQRKGRRAIGSPWQRPVSAPLRRSSCRLKACSRTGWAAPRSPSSSR